MRFCMIQIFFSQVVLLISLEVDASFKESIFLITLISMIQYKPITLPDFCQFQLKSSPTGFRPDRTE